MTSIGSQSSFNISFAIGNPQFSESKPSSNSLLNFRKSSSFNPLRTPSTARTRAPPIKASASAAADYVSTQSLYELLGISESGTLSDIKNAYRQLARKYHPDVSPPDRTEEYTKMFLEVQEAYETLSDPQTRASYDRDLARGLGLYSLFNGRNRSCSENSGFVERGEWESQLEQLIRNSDSDGNNDSWGARMRSKRRSNS